MSEFLVDQSVDSPESVNVLPADKSTEKRLMNSFFAANMADLLVTLYAVTALGFQEVNPIAKQMFEEARHTDVAALKLAITSGLLLLFALGNDSDSRFKFSYEKSLIYGKTIIWLIVVLNTLQVMAELVN